MSDPLNITTLASRAEFSQDVRKSRFLAHACHVAAPEDAMTFLGHVARDDANHNCWAYQIGDEYRFSDDGEPASTAGRPILMAIQGQSLDQVMVVVTRYFGGIKLGAGGLVRAYGGCAAECLRLADKRVIVATRLVEIEIPFETMSAVFELLDAVGATRESETYQADGAVLTAKVPVDALVDLRQQVRDRSRGQAVIRSLRDSQ